MLQHGFVALFVVNCSVTSFDRAFALYGCRDPELQLQRRVSEMERWVRICKTPALGGGLRASIGHR